MSTVYLGTSDFAAAVLRTLAESDDTRPALVITRPDRPSGRGRRLTAPPVAVRARELGLDLAQPESVNDQAACELIAAALARAGGAGVRDALVVCAFGAIVREPLLSEHEILNVHPSLLPRWRGAAPVERAIMAGDERTGVSIMRLEAGLDSGPVCLAAEEPIGARDTYGSLAGRLQRLGGELLLRALRERPAYVEQDEAGVTYAEKISAEDRLLDPARRAEELERQARALTPHIGARVRLPDGSLLGVRAVGLADPDPEMPAGPPGVLAWGERLLLRCSPGAIELLTVQPAGAREMDAAAYLRGHAAAVGLR